MFNRSIHHRIVVSYFLVLFSCFLAVLVTTSVFVRKTYFTYALNDLKDDAGLFVDEFTKSAIIRADEQTLRTMLRKKTGEYEIELFGENGIPAVSSRQGAERPLFDVSQPEFRIIPGLDYGYALRGRMTDAATVYVVVPIERDGVRIGYVRISTPLAYIEKTIRRLQWYVLLVFAVGAAISLPVGVVLSRDIAAPLLQMARIAREVSGGNLTRRVELKKRSDEIGILADTFNDMIGKLQRAQEDRTVLLGNLSHELMTPITAIRGFAETLYEGRVTDRKIQGECLEAIKAESGYLEHLIEELRFISRVDAFSVKYDLRPVLLTEVIVSAEKSLAVQAEALRSGIVNDFPSDCPPIRADRYALRQLFVNLLDNALKYSPPASTVTVYLRRKDAVLEAAVCDTGPGIASGDREKIFERFYRGKNDRRPAKGIGLGLAIVKEIAAAHQASVTVEPVSGGGSCFTVSFPVL